MTTPDAFGPPTRDPWKGLRGVMAGMLVLEAIVVLLALPVVATTGDGMTPATGGYVVALGLAMIVMSGMQRRPWALRANLGLQVLAIAAFVFSAPLGAVGVLFAAVWAYLMYLRHDIAARMAAGRLPGQRS